MPSFSLEYVENGQTQSFPFDSASVSIGRDKASDFVLDHPTVSRQHALIVHNQRGYQLVVLSRGGMTAVDGSPVSGDVDLFDGNVLHFGQLHFTFRSPDAPAKAAGGGGGASSSFGQQPAGGFGGQQAAGGFGGQQAAGGFGGQQAGGGFGGQQAAGGFGGQQAAGGFGGQQAAGGFGGQQAAGGFGGQQQPANGGFGAPQGGFGDLGGGGAGPEASKEPADPNGIRSWDEIAQSAEAMDDRDDHLSDFQRIQAAQAKAVEQSKGSSPILVVGAAAMIALLMAYTFGVFDGDKGGPAVEETPISEAPPIKWDEKDLDCIGEADCMQKAERAFAVGVDNLEKQDVELSFMFQGYKNLELADKFVEKAGKPRPAQFAKADAAKKQARDELDVLFRKFRAEYHNAETRKMYKDMVAVIRRVKTYFPYKGAREHQWAVARENDMKDRGIYPKTYR